MFIKVLTKRQGEEYKYHTDFIEISSLSKEPDKLKIFRLSVEESDVISSLLDFLINIKVKDFPRYNNIKIKGDFKMSIGTW